MKLKVVEDQSGSHYGWAFYCPACDAPHTFRTDDTPLRPRWNFSGDVDKPTFTPSLKLSSPANEYMSAFCCHLIMTEGHIYYCMDCTHGMAGQTVELPDFPEERFSVT